MKRLSGHPLPLAAVLAAVLAAGSTTLAGSALFMRGDANGDTRLNLSDPAFTLRLLFVGGSEALCDDAIDANDDGVLDISDAMYTIDHLFLGGPPPSLPGLACGTDPTADALGCEEFPACDEVRGEFLSARLHPADGCGAVLGELRVRMIENMESALRENQAYALRLTSGEFCRDVWVPWGGWGPWGGPAWGGQGFFGGGGAPAMENAAPPPPPRQEPEAASEHSETNTQVEGVDEADFVKNDGAHIYIVAGGQFQIIDAWPAAQAHKVAAVELEGTPRKLFVHDDRAVVYSSLEPLRQHRVGTRGDWDPGPDVGECTYGYDCEFTGDRRRLRISVFDISDRSSPRLLREIDFSGSYLGARRIGDLVYTVVIFPEAIVPGLAYWPPFLEDWEPEDFCWVGLGEDEIQAMFTELHQRNLELIENASMAELLPGVTDTRYESDTPVVSEELLQSCREFYLSGSGDGQSLLSLVSFDLGGLEDLETTTVVGRPGAVYASLDSLYVATRHQGRQMTDWYFESVEAIPEATTLHKFRLSPSRTGTSYVGSGVVKGRILNQFSLDEYEGHLRIATTTGRVPSPTVHSTVSVLAETRGRLDLVGQVDGIAPTEDIRSVRFHGDVGYMVTFKKTDPLFVVDLSVPEVPMIRGELKIPGYSTYMHMLDDAHILSIGFDAEDQGNFAWFQGILLQIFDVADLENPTLIHREVIGTRGSTSDAATNHLAFNFFRSRSLLALPMVICEGASGGGDFGDRMTFSGLMVYHVDLASGFDYLGGVPHAATAPGDGVEVSCNNWWTRSNSQVKRSIFMDDFVYAVALDVIDVAHLADLESPVTSVSLEE